MQSVEGPENVHCGCRRRNCRTCHGRGPKKKRVCEIISFNGSNWTPAKTNLSTIRSPHTVVAVQEHRLRSNALATVSQSLQGQGWNGL